MLVTSPLDPLTSLPPKPPSSSLGILTSQLQTFDSLPHWYIEELFVHVTFIFLKLQSLVFWVPPFDIILITPICSPPCHLTPNPSLHFSQCLAQFLAHTEAEEVFDTLA